VVVLLAAGPIHSGEPALPGVIDTGRGHQQLLRLLDAQGLVIDQHVHRVSPQPRINLEAEVVEPNLPLLPHPAGLLAEAEDPPETS
jgi:hypothetical protein